ncbi:MAG: S-methyl-5-thioribose-1-phosphate isomerase [Anaerovoracaceae bacterium]
MNITPIKYENNSLRILDQRQLPGEELWLEIHTAEDVWEAIHQLKVRGAPAIGIAAAFGICVALRYKILEKVYTEKNNLTVDEKEERLVKVFELKAEFLEIKKYLETARPTAVNLFWALNRMEEYFLKLIGYYTAGFKSENLEGINKVEIQIQHFINDLLKEAKEIRKEDEEACRKMGEFGLSLLQPGMGILTHCNAGSLATAKYGTSIAPLYLGHEQNYDFIIFVDETRPLLQGARLTAWELNKVGMDVTLICDNMASIVMKNGWIDAVMVGCDRLAASGDGANKIGTSGLAILAKEYGIPFYMFVPTSTIDIDTKTGGDIEIEFRDGEEISKLHFEKEMAPKGIKKYNPSFDVTDNRYITAIITEKGIIYPPFAEGIKKILNTKI